MEGRANGGKILQLTRAVFILSAVRIYIFHYDKSLTHFSIVSIDPARGNQNRISSSFIKKIY